MSVHTSILLNTLFQVVSGGPIYFAEYVVVEANCTDDACVPLNDAMGVSTQSISLVIYKKKKLFSKLLESFIIHTFDKLIEGDRETINISHHQLKMNKIEEKNPVFLFSTRHVVFVLPEV